MPDPDLSGLAAVSLADVIGAAAATVRVDRKYLVPAATAQRLLDEIPDDYRALEIAGRRWTSYRSTYFDTHDLLTCRAHVQQRRRRWKARSRLYVEDRMCRLEVKVRDGSGRTEKSFHPTAAGDYGRWTRSGAEFLHGELTARGFPVVHDVRATLEVGYRRATLADLGAGQRVTFDAGVRCESPEGVVRLDSDLLVVETKGAARPSRVDRMLVAMGARAVPFSKYAAALALIDGRIADNDVRRMVGRELHVELGRTR